MIDPISKAYQAIYQKKEEPKKEEKLPELYDGKYEEPDGNEKPSYYRDKEKPIQESTDEVPKIDGLKVRDLDDYDKADYQAHLESKAHISFAGTAFEHHDKAVHDLVKDGLTPDKYLAAKHILNNVPHDYDSRYDRQVHPYDIQSKYDFIDHFAATEDHDYKPEETFLSKDEIQKHLDSGYKLIRGRKIRHEKTGIYLQLHPDGSKTISKMTGQSATPVDKDSEAQKTMNNLLSENHSDHIQNTRVDDGTALKNHVHMYTEDSRELNTYLGHQYHGKTWNSDMRKYDDATLDAHSDGLSQGIKTAPPLAHPVTIYSGLSHMTKVHTLSDGGTKHVRFTTPTFLSTSIDPETAASFAREKDHPHPTDESYNEFSSNLEHNEFGKGAVADMVKMELPKGFRGGLYVDSHSANQGEREYLLDKRHVIHIHPSPKYFVYDRKMTRMWHAEVEPKKYEDE